MRHGNMPFVEFSRRERPSPSAHNHERSDAIGIRERKTETGRAAPIVANHGRVADIELPQQVGQVCDVAIETMRLLPNRLLRQAKADHVGDNDAPAASRQRFHKFPIQESPSGIAVQ